MGILHLFYPKGVTHQFGQNSLDISIKEFYFFELLQYQFKDFNLNQGT